MQQAVKSIFNRCIRTLQKNREIWGYPKRDLVVQQVIKAKDSLESAKDQFESALEQFSEITNFDGGTLQERYQMLKIELERSENQSNAVSRRISAVEKSTATLFEEWQQELDQYSNRQLRSNSKRQLKQAQQHYKRLITVMRKAESRIQPVLTAFRDQVLFMKHNLNAQAIASIHHEFRLIGVDIAALIVAMENSILEANAFVQSVAEQKSLPCN